MRSIINPIRAFIEGTLRCINEEDIPKIRSLEDILRIEAGNPPKAIEAWDQDFERVKSNLCYTSLYYFPFDFSL